MKRRLLPALLSIAALTGLAAFAAPATAADTSVRIAIPVPTMNYYPIFIARDLGYFKDEGIDVEVVVTQGDGPDVDALIAGSVQFAATTPNRLLTAYQGGKPLLGIMTIANRVAINCFINKEKATELGIDANTPFADRLTKLKGLTIGGTRPGSFTYLLAIDYLKRAGYVPQEDAKVIGVGGGPAMLAAVENKQIDIGCLASPTPELGVSRGTAIMFVNNTQGEDPEFKEFLFSMLYVRPDYAKSDADTVRKVVKALLRGLDYVVKTPFAEQKAQLHADFGDIDDKILEASLINTQAAIEPSGRISEKAYAAASQFLVDTDMLKGDVPFSAVIDNSFLPQ
jgi:NitT/TauT family transport system substrate-binding protein